MDQHRIHIIVETLCERGCQEVNGIIERLSVGEPVDETQHLSREELDQVRRELQAIMAVYDKPCDL